MSLDMVDGMLIILKWNSFLTYIKKTFDVIRPIINIGITLYYCLCLHYMVKDFMES